jgi:hypothetical protein
MLSPVTVALVPILLLAIQTAATVPQTTTPTAPVPMSPDPANSAFAGEAGLILVAIKPAATADYETVIRALQGALVQDTDASRRAAAKGWRVFKSGSPDAKGNVLYIHVMLPAVPGFDYRPSLLVDTLVKDLAPELLTKYQDAFAGPPSKLDLSELANMTVAPLAPAEPVKPEIKKPGP